MRVVLCLSLLSTSRTLGIFSAFIQVPRIVPHKLNSQEMFVDWKVINSGYMLVTGKIRTILQSDILYFLIYPEF